MIAAVVAVRLVMVLLLGPGLDCWLRSDRFVTAAIISEGHVARHGLPGANAMSGG